MTKSRPEVTAKTQKGLFLYKIGVTTAPMSAPMVLIEVMRPMTRPRSASGAICTIMALWAG
ncbi:hypothetical protein D3C72_2311210 [compost metagenome]